MKSSCPKMLGSGRWAGDGYEEEAVWEASNWRARANLETHAAGKRSAKQLCIMQCLY